MRMHSLASIAAALILTMGGALSAPALAQADGSTDGGTSPSTKKKRVRKPKAGTPDGGTAAAAPSDGTPPPAAAADAGAAPTPSKTTKKKRSRKGQAAKQPPADDFAPAAPPAPPPPATTLVVPAPMPEPVVVPAPPQTTVMIKEAAPVAPPVAPPPDVMPSSGYDDDAPTIAHIAIKSTLRNKPLVFTAHITDPSGVFQPVLYLRKRGTGDYIPIKLIGSKTLPGDYAVEADAKLISVDLEYYIECYDNLGNGPARVGTPENPLVIMMEDEKKVPIIGVKAEPERHVGAPPAISHSTIAKAYKGAPIEINAKLVGDTGVSKANVFFRHIGEHDFRTLPMGNIGGDDYTATMPASVVTGDLEYYLEAYDQYGNGPGRTGGPNVPYQITVTDKPVEPKIIAPPAMPYQTAQPHLVKLPFSPNPGRSLAYLFIGGFIGCGAIAGGELYGAYNADQAYKQTYNYDGRLDQGLHENSLNYEKRAKYLGIAAAGSLVIGIVLLVVFPAHPDTQIVTGSGGDAVLAHF